MLIYYGFTNLRSTIHGHPQVNLQDGQGVGRRGHSTKDVQGGAGQQKRPPSLISAQTREAFEVPQFTQRHAEMDQNPLMQDDLSGMPESHGTHFEPRCVCGNGSHVRVPEPANGVHRRFNTHERPGLDQSCAVII